MGSPPPPDNPPPEATPPDTFATPGPPVSSLCGFALPLIPNFLPSFTLPIDFLLPVLPPIPALPLGIDCLTSNPQDVSSGVAYGGGRVSNQDPSPDLDENNQ